MYAFSETRKEDEKLRVETMSPGCQRLKTDRAAERRIHRSSVESCSNETWLLTFQSEFGVISFRGFEKSR